MQTKQYSIAILASLMLVVGTMIASAGATYPYGANPVLMKNVQAQEGGLVDDGNGTDPERGPPFPVPQCTPESHIVGNETVQCFTPVTPEPEPVVTPAPVPGTPTDDECTPEEAAVIDESEQAAGEVVEAIEGQVMNPEDIEAVENATGEVVETVEESVTNGTTSEEVEEVTEEVVEAVENATEGTTEEVEESANDALINLLEGLVNAQQFNENLTQDEKTELVNNLEEVKEQLG